jgi:limonene-1,2-epoxide hydrolase
MRAREPDGKGRATAPGPFPHSKEEDVPPRDPKATTNLRIIIALFKAFEGGTRQHIWDGYDLYLSEDGVYNLTGFPAMSKSQAKEILFSDIGGDAPVTKIVPKLGTQEAIDDLVFIEHVDSYRDKSGKELFKLPVASVFQLKGGKVRKWTDYCDPRPLLALYGERFGIAAE